jgi:hypothetical protein
VTVSAKQGRTSPTRTTSANSKDSLFSIICLFPLVFLKNFYVLVPHQGQTPLFDFVVLSQSLRPVLGFKIPLSFPPFHFFVINRLQSAYNL